MNSRFKDFYINSLVKESSKEPVFDGSEDWFEQHKSSTKKRSLVIGIVQESVADWRNYIDFNVLFPIFNVIKEVEKQIVYLSKLTTPEKYIYETLINKYRDRNIELRTINNGIIKEIKSVENEDKIAIATPENTVVFTLKSLIEYI